MKNKSKIIVLILALAMLFSIFMITAIPSSAATITGGTVLYLKPNSNWTQANAWFAAYFCNGSSSAEWVRMTDVDGDGIYEVTVPAGKSHKNVIFCRMNPASSQLDWTNRWNQSGDLTWDGTKNLCSINSGQWDCGTNVTWSNGPKFYLKGDFNSWSTSNAMTVSKGVATCTVDLPAGNYLFKLHCTDSNKWYGNGGIIENTTATTSASGWTMDADANCTLNAKGGRYTFTYNILTRKLIVTWQCLHSNWKWNEATEADCITNGNIAHYNCPTCNKNFDSNGTEITSSVVIQASGHSIENKECTVCHTTFTTVYAYNYKEWESMYCYCWSVDEKGENVGEYIAWPGVEMTSVGEHGLWSYEMPADCNRVIFSNGSLDAVENVDKTIDLVYQGENKVYDTKSTVDYWSNYYPGQYTLEGNFKNLTWGTQYADIPADGNIISWSIALRNGDFEFKITREGYVWYGNNGTFQDTTETSSDTGWTMDYDANNCHFSAKGGAYVFTYNIDTNALSVHRHIYVDGVCTGNNCNDVIDNALELQGAINQAVYDDESSDIVKLFGDIDLTDVIVSDKYFVKTSATSWVAQTHHLYIPEGGTVILDINGHKLISKAAESCNVLLVTDGAVFTLTDTADVKGIIKAGSIGGSVIRNFGGATTIDGGVVLDSDNYTHYTVYTTNTLNSEAVSETGYLLVKDAVVHSGFGCLQVVGGSSANVLSGYFYMDEDSNNPAANQQNIVYLASGAELVIEGGHFESLVDMKGAAVVAESQSYITINEGYFKGPSMSIQSRANSIITLTGGTFVNSFSYGGDTGPGAIENLIGENVAYLTLTSGMAAYSRSGVTSGTVFCLGKNALANAIAVANPGDIITLNRNYSIPASIAVPEGKNIIINLNGYEIDGSDITVNGILSFDDSLGGSVSAHILKGEGGCVTNAVNLGNVMYMSFDKAYAVSVNGDTITLLSDVELPEGFKFDKNITLCLNGCELTNLEGNFAIENYVADGYFVYENAGGYIISDTEIELPEETPDVDVPEIETPDVDVPEIETPDVETPDIETPETQLPDTEEIPDTNEVPDGEIAGGSQLPEINETAKPEVNKPGSTINKAESDKVVKVVAICTIILIIPLAFGIFRRRGFMW